MATTPSPETNDLDAFNIAEQHLPIATTPSPTSTEQHISKATNHPPNATHWDDIDPVTGLSKEYMTAVAIIDGCDCAELRRFNAPLLANRTISIGQQIEMYYNRGEPEEHRHTRKEQITERRKSVVEKVVAIMAFWRRVKSRESRQGRVRA